MRSTLSLCGITSLIAMLSVLGCSREESAPAARATATPAVRVSVAPQAAAPAANEAADELYVDLEAEPDEGAPPLTVKFTTSIEDGTPPYTYSWDFGDASAASTDANPSHVYQKAGEFTATVNVKDSKGLAGSEEYDVLVETDTD
jgi:PKD repeat protein